MPALSASPSQKSQTHNHFVLDRGGKVFKQTAPVIKLPTGASEDDHLALVGLLNSGGGCFWLKQVCQNKGSSIDEHGARQRTMPFEDFYQFNGTKIKQFPVPWEAEGTDNPLRTAVVGVARDIDTLAQARAQNLPAAVVSGVAARGDKAPSHTHGPAAPTRAALDAAKVHAEANLLKMITLQEELDWLVYRAYGLLENRAAESLDLAAVPPITLGERAFEIVMARKMAAGTLQTEWFRRHRSTPATQIPAHWPAAYKTVVEHRIALIESGPKQNKDITLIEQPEHKRRWNTDSWDDLEEKALRGWLLDRLESYFDLDGRMNADKKPTAHTSLHEPRLTSTAQLADIARRDRDFIQVAELFAARQDFDVAALIAELVTAESVPALPVLRYKPAGLEKRVVWERTWKHQREEDRLDALREAARAKMAAAEVTVIERELPKQCEALRKKEAAVAALREQGASPLKITDAKHDLEIDQKAYQRAVRQACDDDKTWSAAKRELDEVSPNPRIDVPPRYVLADFLSNKFWNLRGKLDVPKERWVSFPHAESEDGTLPIAWAGYDHLQLARAIAERYELAKEREGRKLVPLLAAIEQLLPWIKQWHNDLNPVYGARMGDYFEGYLAEEAKALGMSVEQVVGWTPPEKPNVRERRKAKELA